MKKRNLLILGMIFLVTSCNTVINSESSDKTSSQENNDTPISSKLLRTPNENKENTFGETTTDEYQTFLGKIDDFSAKLSDEYYKTREDNCNMTISPLSLYMGLTLAYSCSANNTRREILNALNMTEDEIRKNTEILYRYSNKEVADSEGNVYSQEKLTNSIWFDYAMENTLISTGLDELADNYYCYPFSVGFSSNNRKANDKIRQFIKENTNGMIDQDFDLGTETAIALINTLYFKDTWRFDFEGLSFTDKIYQFENKNQTVSNIKLLESSYYGGKAYETETYRNFYTRTYNGYKLNFIVPNEGYSISDVFTYDTLKEISDVKYEAINEEKKEKYYTRCLFPEFKASCDDEVKDVFMNAFGIMDLFSASTCDFSNITSTNVYCDGIIHVANVDVNKKGAEGAAVTIVQTPSSAPGPMPEEYASIYYDFVVDKNFGVVISDVYGVPLFTTIVNKL